MSSRLLFLSFAVAMSASATALSGAAPAGAGNPFSAEVALEAKQARAVRMGNVPADTELGVSIRAGVEVTVLLVPEQELELLDQGQARPLHVARGQGRMSFAVEIEQAATYFLVLRNEDAAAGTVSVSVLAQPVPGAPAFVQHNFELLRSRLAEAFRFEPVRLEIASCAAPPPPHPHRILLCESALRGLDGNAMRFALVRALAAPLLLQWAGPEAAEAPDLGERADALAVALLTLFGESRTVAGAAEYWSRAAAGAGAETPPSDQDPEAGEAQAPPWDPSRAAGPQVRRWRQWLADPGFTRRWLVPLLPHMTPALRARLEAPSSRGGGAGAVPESSEEL